MDFPTIEYTSKKYEQMTWKLSKFGLRRTDVISTSNRCGFDVVCPLGDAWNILLLQTNEKYWVVKRKAVVSELSQNLFLYIKVNKSLYIAKSRQRYYKTLNNILLHAPNHALKDLFMLNYGIIKITNSSHYIRFFVIKIFYHIISSKQTHLVFCTISTIFER